MSTYPRAKPWVHSKKDRIVEIMGDGNKSMEGGQKNKKGSSEVPFGATLNERILYAICSLPSSAMVYQSDSKHFLLDRNRKCSNNMRLTPKKNSAISMRLLLSHCGSSASPQ